MGEESENKQVNAFEYDKALRDYFSEVGSVYMARAGAVARPDTLVP